MAPAHEVRGWLLLAVAAVLAQQALTTYPDPQGAHQVGWTAFSLVLLRCVYRSSDLARVVFGALATVGFIGYVLATMAEFTSTSASLTLLYAVQAAAMLVAPVRAWTRKNPSPQVALPVE
jgi:hypothetical protein